MFKCALYRLLPLCLAVLMIALVPQTAVADVNFAGFASIVYGKTITDDDEEGTYYGMDNDGEYRDFNLLGLRMDTNLGNNVSFAAQAVVYGEDDYNPQFDWAYAKIDFTPQWSVSVGRTRIPLFMYSSYQDVAYAYPWIKPPFAVYGIPHFKSVDGAQLQYFTNIGEWISSVQAWIGSTRERLTENNLDSVMELDRNMGLAWTMERDWLTLRGVYMETDTTIDLNSNPDLAGLNQLMQMLTMSAAQAGNTAGVAALQDLSEAINWQDKAADYYGFGASLDFGTWFLVSEVTRIDLEESIAGPKRLDSAYLMLGTRMITDWTFSITVSQDRDREHTSLINQYEQTYDAVIEPIVNAWASSGDPDLEGAATMVPDAQEFEGTVLSLQRYDSTDITAIARFDFHRSASLKFEYMRGKREYGGNNVEFKPQAVRIGLDLVF